MYATNSDATRPASAGQVCVESCSASGLGRRAELVAASSQRRGVPGRPGGVGGVQVVRGGSRGSKGGGGVKREASGEKRGRTKTGADWKAGKSKRGGKSGCHFAFGLQGGG